jgi:hypothetical protein
MEVVQIKGTTKTPVRTPDGYYFAAYRKIRRYSRRKLITNRWKALKAAGLLKRRDDAQRTKRLSQQQFNLFLDQLKTS